MATVANAVQVIMGDLGMENYEGEFRVAIPITNVGSVSLSNLKCTEIRFGNAAIINPAPAIPVHLGALGAHGVTSIVARFSTAGLAVGSKYLLSVRGSYQVQGVTYGLLLNRYVSLPAPALPEQTRLRARVQTRLTQNYWTYELINDEPAGSQQWLASFSLQIAAPVAVTGTPPGWSVESDLISYVLWTAMGLVPPYADQVKPGQSLSGFQLMSATKLSESLPCTVVAWDQINDTGGRVVGNYLPTPSRLP